MSASLTKALSLIIGIFITLPLVSLDSPKQVYLISLIKNKKQIQQEVQRALMLPATRNYLPKNYTIQNSVIKSYPTCFFSGRANVVTENINLEKYLILDTIPCYASIYNNNKIELIATANKAAGQYYSFYPVDYSTSNQNKMLENKHSTDIDIKLIKAAEQHSESAFFIRFYPTEFEMPNVIAFYDHKNIRFIDSDLNSYNNFAEIVKAKFGSLDNFKYKLHENSKK